MAAIIGTNLGYILLTFLPPVVWLLFYLREDRHPEPKKLLLLAFAGGMGAALLAVVVELVLIGERSGILSGVFNIQKSVFMFFLMIALVEEYLKYLPVKFFIVRRKEFDEPIDAMIYMMTSALGFAALENTLFILPLFQQDFFSGFEVAANRFLGANLLHALSSGIVGFFLAKSFLSRFHRHFLALGILLATALHAGFNYLILIRGVLPQGTFYLILLLATMAVMVFIDFERLKKKFVNIDGKKQN